jgi:hypothetical protein
MIKATVRQFWVRKLTGKPADTTPPDCEFNARRIHATTDICENDLSLWAAESNALRMRGCTVTANTTKANGLSQFLKFRQVYHH